MPTRRTVLTAAVLAGAARTLSACTPDEDTTPPREAPDSVLARQALEAEYAILALLDSVTHARPKREPFVAEARTIHTAHVELLVKSVPDGERAGEMDLGPGASFPGTDRSAFLAVIDAEDKLGRTLRRAAFLAESGAFARVLAGMAAAAAQQSAAMRGRL